MKISEKIPGIVHAKFECPIEASSTFIRFQEYYESPKFRNEIFTLYSIL